MINPIEATKQALAKFKGAKHIAVINFVGSAGRDRSANRANLKLDTGLYKWNKSTQRAIEFALDLTGK